MDLDALAIRRMADLDRLPWFEKDEAGDIRLREDVGLPPILDVHAHLGWSYGISRAIDHTVRNDVRYFFDYEFDQEFLRREEHPTRQEASSLLRECLMTPFMRPPGGKTHTAANLAAEMDRFNYSHICLMPIEIPFHTRQAREIMAASQLDERLTPFASVHPWRWGPKKEQTLDALISAGAVGVKFHPEFQFIHPTNPHAMRLFEYCADRGVPVLAHAGWVGPELGYMKRRADPDGYREVLRTFPKLKMIMGHTALTQYRAGLAVARAFEDQVWLDVTGLTRGAIRRILNGYDWKKVMYGSDWPFYPIAVAMARALVATESCQEVWPDLFHNNAARLLGLPLC
ncbi:MAG: amidohydrolase family protein [bacterium]|nr:amidohydrolase family protein [bacterium]